MKKLLTILAGGILLAQKPPVVKITPEEQLEIAKFNATILSATIDLRDKEEMARFVATQLKASRNQISTLQQKKQGLIDRFTEKYAKGKKCNFDNIEAELVCEEAPKKEGK